MLGSGLQVSFADILRRKSEDNSGNRSPIIAFLGDSVTQGCFEVYEEQGSIKTVFDACSGYPEKVKRILSYLYPTAPVSIVNLGINGGSAKEGAERFERDVSSCNPDLLIVGFGLNDSNAEENGIKEYQDSLRTIFQKAKQAEIEIALLTPNMFNTYTGRAVSGEICTQLASIFAERQKSGLFDRYVEAARQVCAEEQVKVCDCYKIWKQFYANGADTTALLSNGLNHPIRDVHTIMAWEIVKTILE